MVKSHVEESLGANPADAALNPADQVAMGVPASHAFGFLDSRRGRAFRALRHREYRLLFVAFVINQTGFWVSHIAMQGLMVELTANDPLQMGLLFFALFIPAFVLAPIAGVAADRFDRKTIVLWCYGAVALVSAALAYATAVGAITPELLLLMSFGMGTAFAFSGPSNMAIAANSVPEEDLGSAVSLQSATNNLTRVAGPALAAPLIATQHLEVAFGIFVACALGAGSLVAAMRLSPYEPDDDQQGILARVKSGYVHARERRPALPALYTVAVLSLFGVSHVALLPVFAQDVLGDSDLFAWIVVATGSGALVGALAAGYRQQAALSASALQMTVYAIALAIFAFTDSIVVALLAQVLVGFFYFSVMTSLQTLIQEVVDDSKRGRVMSLFQVAWAGLVPFGGLGMGALADSVGVVATLGGSAAVCAVYGLAMTWRGARDEKLPA